MSLGLNMPESIGLELDLLPYTTVGRLSKVFPGVEIANASPLLRTARSIKTDFEIEMIRRSGVKHDLVYRKIPKLFSPE